jgi:hypothetical protein
MNAQPHSNMLLRPAMLGRLVLTLTALVVVACSSPAGSPSSSGAPAAGGVTSPAPSLPAPSDAPSEAPPAQPSVTPSAPAPTPTPAPAAWSKPRAIAGLENCFSIFAAVDEGGRTHVVATCDSGTNEIRYAVSTDEKTWTVSRLRPPAGRLEEEPQLAFSGNTLYLAYTRIAIEEGGCGDDGLRDLGVYVRSRSLPAGAWSAPTRIGNEGEHLLSFRVAGSTIHAAVATDAPGSAAYIAVSGGATRRVRLPDALGAVALRVGDDGTPRVAYEAKDGIAYGTIAGGRVRTDTISGSDRGESPVFALGPGNDAYAVWTRSVAGGGCAEPGPDALDGIYFSTNEHGSWQTVRLTTQVGPTSLTVDPSTGEVHVLVEGDGTLVWYHRSPGGKWAHETLARKHAVQSVIRQDPTSGRLVIVSIVDSPADDEFHVQVRTR